MTYSKITDLSETSAGMSSNDYKDRFVAEYDQVCYRLDRLAALLEQYHAGTLTFTPVCPYDLLMDQYEIMTDYRLILEERAKIEGIDLG